MEITLAGAVVHLVLFFSILFLYCVVGSGRIKYCSLDPPPQSPQSAKKRKTPPEHIEELEEEEENIISMPIDISKEEDQDSIDISEKLNIDSIKKEIESTCNFATASEGVAALKNNPSEITDRLQTGFDLWEQKTGKKGMTYSELREMFG